MAGNRMVEGLNLAMSCKQIFELSQLCTQFEQITSYKDSKPQNKNSDMYKYPDVVPNLNDFPSSMDCIGPH